MPGKRPAGRWRIKAHFFTFKKRDPPLSPALPVLFTMKPDTMTRHPASSSRTPVRWFFAAVLLLLVAAAALILRRPQGSPRPLEPDPSFAAYVSGYTGGVISRRHPILIRLARPPAQAVQPGDPLEAGLLSFSPHINGEARWKDQRTLEFLPAGRMKPGQVYTATLDLDRLLKDSRPGEFRFGFQVIPARLELRPLGLRAEGEEGLGRYDFEGEVLTADETDAEAVEKVLSASYGGRSLSPQWTHESGTTHRFVIRGLARGAEDGVLRLRWEGAPAGAPGRGEKRITVPAKGSFTLLQARIESGAEPVLHLLFSDPLEEGQPLEGLVQLDSLRDMTQSVRGNELVVYPGRALSGPKDLLVSRGLRNLRGSTLAADRSLRLVFEGLKPALRFVNQGNILPSTEGLILPIEAVNLRSVALRVIKIYQDRVGQFLQASELDGTQQLTRVGRPVLQKIIRLDNMGVKDLGHWNRFTLELSRLIAPEPGALYQVALAFSRDDALLPCSTGGDEGLRRVGDPREQPDTSDFDNGTPYFYDDFGRYYGEDYDWEQRDNPCNSAYYADGRNVIRKNLLASDIGLMAKEGQDGSLLVVATDLRTAEPLKGARLTVYDYQLQPLASTSTGQGGLASMELPRRPFLVEAQNGSQRGYLKLGDGHALSVSQFDVSGDPVQRGIKGFLYGERGVWRPGDSIYLSFMLDDRDGRLPEHHPVVLELSNPRGMLVQRLVRSSATGGIYRFATATAPDAPTGNWSATVRVGGASFHKTLKVETVKPNRLKITLAFPAGGITPSRQEGRLQVRWLSGSPAGSLRAEYDMVLSQGETTFKGYPGYVFDDAGASFKTVERNVFSGSLDAGGTALVRPAIHLEGAAPPTLNAYFRGKVFEPGGSFSVNYQSVPFHPYSRYIGIRVPEGSGYGGMLDLDKDYSVEVATLGEQGAPVDMDSLEVSIYKTRWRWWWEENGSDGADFVHSRYYQLVSSSRLSTRHGQARFPLRIASPQWGRYYIRVSDPASGYTCGTFVYFEWPDGESPAGMPGGATRLTFTPDKTVYQVGDTMRLYIPGSGQGRAFISVENGSRVLRTFWLNAAKGTNLFTLPVTADMCPNVYLHVSVLQPHGQTVNDLPLRQYGIVGVKVEDPATLLAPAITMPAKLRPGEPVKIRVSERHGHPMAYTLAVVDEGLLDLTNFKTPDPWNAFYAHEALGVRTWDIFDQVIGAYGARLERLLSIGGDGSAEQEDRPLQNLRFQPVVRFFGPFELGAGRTATHAFVMPNYVGSVRVMLVAGEKGAYGFAEKTVPVSQPLMILSTLPRVTGPGEEISLPVNVFAMEAGVRDVTVKVSTDSHFRVTGAAKQQLHFRGTGDSLLSFRLQAAERAGQGKVHVVATGGGYTSVNDIDLSVRNPNPPQTTVLRKTLQPGERWTPELDLFGLPGTQAAELEVGGVPPLSLGRRLRYLIEYPYGCLEQTTSAVFPQLYLGGLVALSEQEKKDAAAHVREGIRALSAFQHASGGFSYWPGSNYPDDWASSYAGHFLLEARQQGYAVMDAMMNAWTRYQAQRANQWRPQHGESDQLIQAYRLYTLALAQQPQWGAMNRLRAEPTLSLQARWRLADAYATAGQAAVAQQLVAGASQDPDAYRGVGPTYGSSLRDKAMILQTLVDMGRPDQGFELARQVAGALNGDGWMSTQETSFGLIAMARYYDRRKGMPELQYSYQLDGATHAVHSRLPESRVQIPLQGDRAPRLALENSSGGTLYAQVMLRGTPAAGKEQAVQQDLRMTLRYTGTGGGPLDPAELAQGTDFVAQVTIYNPGLRGDYRQLVLEQVFPSGWEIRNARFEGGGAPQEGSTPDYQDIRDDRVYTFFDLPAGRTKVFRIQLSATYAGRFYLPGVHCSAMYDHRITALVPGRWVSVRQR